MIDENKIIEDTLLDLCNRVWRLNLYAIRDKAWAKKNCYSVEEDEDYQNLIGQITALEEMLGELLVKVGNSDLSLMVNSLILVKKE